MKAAPFTTPDRVVIPCYCWVRKPGTWDRCTEDPGHEGEHIDWASRQTWPNRGPEPQ
ncbi:hypothetical protein J7I98_08380 [Streptomyces sp. ISL-98]|uniref:hypothetical protein n=1 Tax=Streptomyces sp. ISL-98 TaxID=2819192 RepID=UPI001BE6CB35|nr:hypothetical protein [Streptomyces sp. ISL-98]MBT2505913.1 hypothetical protein [Streptomyces sp. ISL-98]